MLGAMLAGMRKSHPVETASLRNFSSIAGFAALGVAVAFIGPSSQFPGWWALLPTVGTALIIVSGQSWLNRIVLSHRALVGIGLISYPLYLWHWPLLSFPRIIEGETPTLAIRAGAIMLSFALAYLTYLIVEKPIRFGARSGFRTCAALGAALLAIGLVGLTTRSGIPASREPILVNAGEIISENGHEIFFTYQLDHFHLCTPEYIQKRSLREYWPARCLQSKPSDVKQVAIIGDSHAEDLFIGLAERFKDVNFVTYINSLPIRSTGAFDAVFDYVESDKNIRSIILAAYWNFLSGRVELPGFNLEAELTKTVSELVRFGKTVYLVDDRPAFPFDPSVCKYARPRLFWQAQRVPHCAFERSLYNLQRKKYHPALESVAKKFSNVYLLETADTFCDEKYCRMAKDNVLFFRDRAHMTIAGSRAVASRLSVQLQGNLLKATADADMGESPSE